MLVLQLLDLRLDGEITKLEFEQKRSDLELDQAKLSKRVDDSQALMDQGEDGGVEVKDEVPASGARKVVEDVVLGVHLTPGSAEVDEHDSAEARLPSGVAVEARRADRQ